jgi:hypothetical protein
MITSVIVPKGHGDKREKKKMERNSDEEKTEKEK